MLEIRLLGQFDVQQDGKPIEIASRPARLLFAYLALHADVEHRREKLAGLIWPEMSDTNARNNLRHALWRIRKAIQSDLQDGREYLLSGDVVTFNSHSNYWLDVAILEEDQSSLDDLIRAVSAYSGELLPGWYEDWVLLERERVQALFERKMQMLLARQINEQRWSDILEWGERWIALGHTPEPAYRALMIAHSHLGDMSSVAAVYQRCVEALRKDLNVEPSEQTRQLYEQLLKRETPSPVDRSTPPTNTQPGTAGSAAEPSVYHFRPMHNLPIQPTPFIGRTEELAGIAKRLNEPACRLLSLIGPGGIGKTRLALRAASDHAEKFGYGVCFVALAAVSAPEFLVPAIADALKFSLYGQESPRSQLLNYLREKELLLVVDNFEHLLEGVGLLEEILTTAQAVKLLVTSRERLHLQWEWILGIEGMDFPKEENETIGDYSAVKLFVQTAQRVHSRFSLVEEGPAVAHICRLVQGIPLAIELAAAWVRVLSCAEIAQQIKRNLDLLSTSLRDVPERHRSIQAVFEQSWNMLSHEEQRVYRQLSLFEGGFQREAAENVASAPLSLLFSLADKSFLRRTSTGRYEMHELLRQFATAKLLEAADEKESTYQRMAQYGLRFAQRHRSEYAELEEEWGNLLAGLRVASDTEMWQVVVDFSNALTEAWFARGRFSDARRGFEWACAAAQKLNDQHVLASCLREWGRACIEQGDYAEARSHLSASLELNRQQDDPRSLADVQLSLARIAIEEANFGEAERLLAESRSIRERLDDRLGVAEILYRQARIHTRNRNYVEAEQLASQAMTRQQDGGDTNGLLRTLRLLAHIVLYGRNDHELAEKYCQHALDLCEQLQDQGERGATYYVLAQVCRRRDDLKSARAYAESSLTLLRFIGDRKSQANVLNYLSLIEADLKNYTLALKRGFQSLNLLRELRDEWSTVSVMLDLGDVLKSHNEPDRARQLWTDALMVAEPLNHPLTTMLRERLSSI